jgi:replicative DNA helicase
MFLYRHTVYDEDADPQEAEILLEKNRHGPIKNIRCRFIEDQMLWTNPVSQWDNAYQGDPA